MEKHQSSDLLDENLEGDFWEKKLSLLGNRDQSQNSQHSTLSKKPSISRIEQSLVLDRVKSFLPQLEAANQSVLQGDPDERNIENTDNCKNVIEMDLAFVENLQKTALCNLLEDLSSDSSDSDNDSEINSNCLEKIL